MNILVIDNIDSFVYNIVQYLGTLGAKPIVYQNTTDLSTIKKIIKKYKPTGIVISPGPKAPRDAGISNTIIFEYGPDIPLMGVCLGHQCIGYVYGAEIRGAKTLMHGKVSNIRHNSKGVLKGIPNPFIATRYHSLVINDKTLPECLEITAWSEDDREIMGVQHKEYPIYGVQFHPESILTADGMQIIKNFINVIKKWDKKK